MWHCHRRAGQGVQSGDKGTTVDGFLQEERRAQQRREPLLRQDSACGDWNMLRCRVMAQVLANLRESIERSPRKVWLIYGAPLLHDAVDRAAIFQRHSLVEIGGSEFRVYASG